MLVKFRGIALSRNEFWGFIRDTLYALRYEAPTPDPFTNGETRNFEVTLP